MPSGSAPSGSSARARPLQARTTHNAEVAEVSGVDRVSGAQTDLDLRGRGVLLGDWDDGHARDTHVELAGRIVVRDHAGISEHATHTTATAVGAGEGRGMAPAARVWAHDWLLDMVELEAAAPALAVSNHPYGLTMGWSPAPDCPDRPTWWGGEGERQDARFGKYGPDAAQLDRVIHRTGLPSFWPAGNERLDIGVAAGEAHYHVGRCGEIERDAHVQETTLQYGTVGGQGVAKNVITVGGVRVVSGESSGRHLWPVDISAFGPTDDGRIKPELAMAGEDVRSAIAEDDDAYGTFQGTSSAVSAAAGVAALISELYRQQRGADLTASDMRALLVHGTREAGPAAGPDYRLGYGVLDARRAAETVEGDAEVARGRRILAGALGGVAGDSLELSTVESVPAGSALRVVLAWSDPPAGVNTGGLDDATPALVHDLDLSLIAPDGTTFRPWSLDPGDPMGPATASGPNTRDNLEVVDVTADDNASDGVWQVRVESASAHPRGAVQGLSLVSSVALEPPAQPLLRVPRTVTVERELGETSEPVAIPIGTQGGVAIAWQASTESPGVALTSDQGGAGDPLVLELDPSLFAQPGERLARVRLDSDDPRGPRMIGVLVRATCEPDCDGRECGADPRCGMPCGRCERGQVCETGSCAAAVGGCPSGDLGDALGTALVQDRLGGSGDQAGSCGGSESSERGFLWTAPSDGTFVVSTRGSEGDTVVYVHDGTCAGAELACNDDSGGVSSAVSLSLVEAQEVALWVEGRGDVELGIRPERCPDADLGARTGIALVRASTFGGVDGLQGSCGGEDTEDVVFGWRAPAAGAYAFRLFDPRYQAVLYVLEGDCEGAELGCSPAPDVGAVELDLDAGESVVIVVDGREGNAGGFELDVLALDASCAGQCGQVLPGCACDASCVARGDCCIDACEQCDACRCQRTCDGRSCGEDGCGGSCGDCGAGLRCADGRCDPDPCEGVSCDACSECVDGGCRPLPEGAPCEDGDLCTVLDVCEEGRCEGQPRDCDDGVPCTADLCDPETGRCEPEPSEECERCDGGVDCPRTLLDPPNPPDVDADAGVPPDGGVRGPSGGGDDGGCGCRLQASAEAGGAPAWPWLLLAWAWRRMGRRRKRS